MLIISITCACMSFAECDEHLDKYFMSFEWRRKVMIFDCNL